MSSENSLASKTANSAVWQISGGIWATIIRLSASFFLARTLSPLEFGVFGMSLLIFEFISYIAAFGLGTGIIAKNDVSEADLNTCFWGMAAVRITMFALCWLSAPLASWFFQEEKVVDILHLISFTFLISIAEIVPATLLAKEMRFKTINIISSTVVFLESILVVVLAVYFDLGYWSLVFGMLFSSTFTSLAFFYAAKWRPRFMFSRESFKYQANFGINGLGFSIMNYLNQNLDYLIVGRVLGARSLGLYEFAYRIPHLIQLRVVQPVGNVLFPSLATIKDDDERLINAYIKTVKFLCLIAFPCLFGMASVAENMVLVLWGSQWAEIILPLQILCFCAVLRVIPQSSGAILLCKNRPDLPFKISMLNLLCTVIAVSILGYLWGITGVACGMLVSALPSFLYVYYSFTLTHSSPRLLLKVIYPIAIASITCSVLASLTKYVVETQLGGGLVITLLSAIAVGGIAYIAVLFRCFPSFTIEIIETAENMTGKNIDLRRFVKYE